MRGKRHGVPRGGRLRLLRAVVNAAGAQDAEPRRLFKPSALVIRLQQTPKMLGHVRHSWCPAAFVVSFKLETDPEILHRKASASLRTYGAHVVVANEMAKRRDAVWMCSLERVAADGSRAPGTVDELTRPRAARHRAAHRG